MWDKMCNKTEVLNLRILFFLLKYQKIMNMRENYEMEIETDRNEIRTMK